MSVQDELQTLLEDYMKVSSSNRTTPIRSPFSHTAEYASGQASGEERWLDLTDVYNVTYRTVHHDNGYNKVCYNPTINVLVMMPKDGAEAYEQVDFSPVVQFGLKAARGYSKDYRWMDMSIPGSGKVAVTEETAENMITDPYGVIQKIRPEYMRALGEIPIDDEDYTANVAADLAEDEILTESAETDPIHLAVAASRGDIDLSQIEDEEKREKARDIATDIDTDHGLTTDRDLEDDVATFLNKIIHEELSRELALRENAENLDLNNHEASAVKKALRQYQMKEETPNIEDSMIDKLADELGESEDGLELGVTSEEAEVLRKSVARYYDNVSDPDIEGVAKKLNVQDPDVE